MHRSPAYATVPCASGRRPARAFHEAGPPEPAKPRSLDRVRAAARLRHYRRRTEAAYVAWIRRDIFFHGQRHPAELGAPEVTGFLSSLAIDGRVAASTQNQALGALLFRYRDVLEIQGADRMIDRRNSTFDQPDGSHPLAAAGQRER